METVKTFSFGTRAPYLVTSLRVFWILNIWETRSKTSFTFPSKFLERVQKSDWVVEETLEILEFSPPLLLNSMKIISLFFPKLRFEYPVLSTARSFEVVFYNDLVVRTKMGLLRKKTALFSFFLFFGHFWGAYWIRDFQCWVFKPLYARKLWKIKQKTA